MLYILMTKYIFYFKLYFDEIKTIIPTQKDKMGF